MEKAQHFAEEALHVAERLDDAARLVGGHMALGVVLYNRGKLEPALAQFRLGFELFDPNMLFPDWPGSHPGVQCQFWPASSTGKKTSVPARRRFSQRGDDVPPGDRRPDAGTLVFLLYQKGRDSRIFQAQDRAIDNFTLKGICAVSSELMIRLDEDERAARIGGARAEGKTRN